MTIDRSTSVFFDASCLIAASGSPTGGSAFLLSLCGRGFLVAVVSQPVLLEAEGNIAGKLGDRALAAYHRILMQTPMVVAPVPATPARQLYRRIAGEKDEHVLVACVAAGAPFLLTLDKRLATRVNEADLERLRALSPGDVID